MDPFVTQDKREIPLVAVGKRYIQQIWNKYPIPDPPTYEVELVGGGKQAFPHVVNSQSSTLTTLEDHQAWTAYQARVVETTGQRFEALLVFLMCRCVDLEPPPLSQWSMDFAEWGLDPPDSRDKQAYKVFWIENELVPDPDDQAALVSRLYQIAGILGEDDVKEFERFFRSTVARLFTS